MRSTVVPAQITTVEDKIAGSLGLSQLLLLALPVFGGSLLFVALPPFFNYALYKVVLIVCFAVLCGLLAIRIKGRILLFWAIALLRYNFRARYYIFNKNDASTRELDTKSHYEEVDEEIKQTVKSSMPIARLSTTDMAHIENLITNPHANLHFKTNRKGELSVHITEIK